MDQLDVDHLLLEPNEFDKEIGFRASRPVSTASSLFDEVFEDALESPLSRRSGRPQSTFSNNDFLSLAGSDRNTLQVQVQVQMTAQETAAIEAKRSISSLRKLALRLAVRISVKEASIATHSRSLARSRMSQYLTERGMSDNFHPHILRPDTLPLSPPESPSQSPGPDKPLPSLPRCECNNRGESAGVSSFYQPASRRLLIPSKQSLDGRVSEDTQGSQATIFSASDSQRCDEIDASRASLERELEATQAKLRSLLESQAVLRERYNEEKEKAKILDAECQKTHAKVSTLERSKHKVQEEADYLQERIGELEQGNERLRSEMKTAKEGRLIMQEDLSKLKSSKITLQHQLQAATGSKTLFESQILALQEQMEAKLAEMETKGKESGDTITSLETERQNLEDDLRVTSFRLKFAVDLERELQSKLTEMRERETALELDLKTSRFTVAQFKQDLSVSNERLSALEETVKRLTTELENSERLKAETAAHLRKDQVVLSKSSGRLRFSRSRLFASEAHKRQLEGDLALVQKRNDELEDMVNRTEGGLRVAEARTNASADHLAISAYHAQRGSSHESPVETISLTNLESCPESTSRDDIESSESHPVEEQLFAHQREIDTLHQTNAELVDKLNEMTKELLELRRTKSVLHLPIDNGLPQAENHREKQGSSHEDVISAELLDMEIKQLQETKATFSKIVESLQSKTAALVVLQEWCDRNDTQPIEKIPAIPTIPIDDPSPEETAEELIASASDVDATGGVVQVHHPTLVHGNYAASEAGIVEMPAHSTRKMVHAESAPPLRKAVSYDGVLSKFDRQSAKDTQTPPRSKFSTRMFDQSHPHRRSVSVPLRSKKVFPLDEIVENIYSGSRVELSAANLSMLNQAYQKELPLRPSFSSISPEPQSPTGKELPLRPSQSTLNLVPRNVIDKQLPGIPRRPVTGHRSGSKGSNGSGPSEKPKVTKDDFEVGLKTWSLFPDTSKSMEIRRPSTASGTYAYDHAQSARRIVPPLPHNSASCVKKNANEPDPHRKEEAGVSEAARRSHIPERFVRLRKSLSILRTSSGRSERPESGQTPKLQKRWSIAGLSSRFKLGQQRTVDASVQVRSASPALVGKPDVASKKIWLIPQMESGNPNRLGMYNRDTEQWFTPSSHRDHGGNVIRVSTGFNGAGTTLRFHPSTESVATIQIRKPGRSHEVKAPSTGQTLPSLPNEEENSVFSEKLTHPIIVESNILPDQTESSHERRSSKGDWKTFWKKIPSASGKLISRPSNLRSSSTPI